EKQLWGGITNAGTITQSGWGLRLVNGSVALNQTSGLWEFSDDSHVIWHTGAEIFYNQGTLRKSAGVGTSQINPRLVNSGTVEILQGTLLPNGGGFEMPDGLLRFGFS